MVSDIMLFLNFRVIVQLIGKGHLIGIFKKLVQMKSLRYIVFLSKILFMSMYLSFSILVLCGKFREVNKNTYNWIKIRVQCSKSFATSETASETA